MWCISGVTDNFGETRQWECGLHPQIMTLVLIDIASKVSYEHAEAVITAD